MWLFLHVSSSSLHEDNVATETSYHFVRCGNLRNKSLSAPPILEIIDDARVLHLSGLQWQEEDLSRSAEKKAGKLNHYHPIRKVDFPHTTPDVDVDDVGDDKAEGVYNEQCLNERRGVLELPINDLVHTLLLKELHVRLVVRDQIRQEDVFHVVEFLRHTIDPG